MFFFFFFNDTATTEIYTLSLHDALPICSGLIAVVVAIGMSIWRSRQSKLVTTYGTARWANAEDIHKAGLDRSEEHTSELQSLAYLVCRLLLEKKKKGEVLVVYGDVSETM